MNGQRKRVSYAFLGVSQNRARNGISVDSAGLKQLFSNAGAVEELLIDSKGFSLNSLGIRRIILKSLLKKEIPVSENFNFIYLNQLIPNLFRLNNGNQIKFIVRIHDLFPIQYPHFFTIRAKLFFRIAALNQQVESTAYLANSRYTSEMLQRFLQIPKENIEIMPCFVAKPQGVACNKCRGCTYEFTNEFCLMVGTIEPRKNYAFPLKFWPKCYEKTKIKLVIVGGYGWKSRHLHRSLRNFEKFGIQYLGSICDHSLDRLFLNSKAFLSTSFDEGFNIPAHQAMLYGKRLYLSNIAVHQEIHDGYKNSVLFGLENQEFVNINFDDGITPMTDKINDKLPNFLPVSLLEKLGCN